MFPGGKVEPGDVERAASPARATSALRAAVRETREEAGLALEPAGWWRSRAGSRPSSRRKRFDTWFFVGARARRRTRCACAAPRWSAHRWIAPADALRAHHEQRARARAADLRHGELARRVHKRAADALRALGRAPSSTFRPHIHRSDEGACMLYPGDAGYESGDPTPPAPRHRLWRCRPVALRAELSPKAGTNVPAPRAQPLNTEISTASGSSSRYSTVEATLRES